MYENSFFHNPLSVMWKLVTCAPTSQNVTLVSTATQPVYSDTRQVSPVQTQPSNTVRDNDLLKPFQEQYNPHSHAFADHPLKVLAELIGLVPHGHTE